MPRYEEKVLRSFNAHGKLWGIGEIYRKVSITETDARRLNARKEDLGFEYILIDEENEEANKKAVADKERASRFHQKKQ